MDMRLLFIIIKEAGQYQTEAPVANHAPQQFLAHDAAADDQHAPDGGRTEQCAAHGQAEDAPPGH